MKLTTTRPDDDKPQEANASGGKYDKFPAGTRVPARVAGIERDDYSFTDKQSGQQKTVEQIQWTFAIMQPGVWMGKDIVGKTTTNFVAHPNCKAYSWATAITQREFAEGEQVEMDNLLGLPCTVEIGHSKPDKEGRTWMRIDNVLPAAVSQHVQAAAPDDAPF